MFFHSDERKMTDTMNYYTSNNDNMWKDLATNYDDFLYDV